MSTTRSAQATPSGASPSPPTTGPLAAAGPVGDGQGPRTPEETSGEKHPLESLGHGSLVTLLGQVIFVGALFGTRVLQVNYLFPLPNGPELYSDLALGLVLSGLVSTLASLGLPTAVARQLAHTTDLEERWRLARNALRLAIPISIAAGALVYLLAPELASVVSHGQGTAVVYQFLSVTTATSILSGVLTAFFQGNEDALPNALFNQTVSPALTLTFLYLFLSHAASLRSALLANVLASVLTLGAIAAYTLGPRGYPWRRGERATDAGTSQRRTSTIAALLAFSLPLAVIGLATSAVGTADSLVLGALAGLGPVAGYTAVLPLSRLVALAVGALGYIMLPVAARLHREGDMVELGRSYATITKWIMLASLPFFLTFFLLPGPSLTFVYGPNFLSATGDGGVELLLEITCLGGFVATLLGPSSAVLVGLGKLRLLVINTFISAGVDIGISFALVPIWGSVGAAVAFSAATALLPLLCVIQTYQIARVHPFTPAVAKPVTVVLVPSAAVLLLLTGPLHWAPRPIELIGVFGVIFFGYLLAVPLTRSIEAGDHHLLQVLESYLGPNGGRRLTFVRAFGRRFLPAEAAPASPPPLGPSQTQKP